MDVSRALRPTPSEAQVASDLMSEPMDADIPPEPAEEATPIPLPQSLRDESLTSMPKASENQSVEKDTFITHRHDKSESDAPPGELSTSVSSTTGPPTALDIRRPVVETDGAKPIGSKSAHVDVSPSVVADVQTPNTADPPSGPEPAEPVSVARAQTSNVKEEESAPDSTETRLSNQAAASTSLDISRHTLSAPPLMNADGGGSAEEVQRSVKEESAGVGTEQQMDIAEDDFIGVKVDEVGKLPGNDDGPREAGMEEDGDEDAEEEEEEIPEDFDVKLELQLALDGCQKSHEGAFATTHTYPSPNTCNPCLQIEGFGLLGLPLSVAEAERLRQVCNQAPFGKGEQSVVDRKIRDTMEIDGSRIKFTNLPHWNTWLNSAVTKACERLGVTGQQYRSELYKLLLYEAGSHFHSHQDTEKAPGMFATLVIVLPSLHEGGSVHVKLGKQEQSFETATQDIGSTTVLAWFTDVFHEVRTVTSGYRLALTYNVIFTGAPVSKPRAPLSDGHIIALGRTLRLWRQLDALGGGPGRLAYMLEHDYSAANLEFGHLKGIDATLVSVLRDQAEQLGFRVALGHLKCTRKGEAEGGYDDDDYGYGYRRGYGCAYDREDVTMGEVHEESYELQMISGATGVAIGRKKGFNTEELMMDEDDLSDWFCNREPDDEEYDGYMGNEAGTLEYFYHTTVVLIWPGSRNAHLITSSGGQKAAIAEVEACTSETPSLADWDHVNIALDSGTLEGAQAVASLAWLWRDCQLFHRAFKVGKGDSNVTAFGVNHVHGTLEDFGFSSMQSLLDSVVHNTMSTQVRLEFLDGLTKLPMASTIPDVWITDKRRYTLSSIRQPSLADIEAIVSVLVPFPDALEFLQKILLPQLTAFNLDYTWWISFSTRLQSAAQDNPQLDGWQAFMFTTSQPVFVRTIKQAPYNQARFTWLDELEQLWSGYLPALAWIAEIRMWAISNLISPGPQDAALLAGLVRSNGQFLQTSLVPTLSRATFVEDFWTDMLRQLCALSKENGNSLPHDWEQQMAGALQGPLRNALHGLPTNQAMFDLLERIGTPSLGHPALHQVLAACRKDALDKLKKPSAQEIPVLLRALVHEVNWALKQFVPQLKTFGLDSAFWNSLVQETKGRSAEILRSWNRDELHKFLGTLVIEVIASTAIKATTSDPATAWTPAYGYGSHNHYNSYRAQPQVPAQRLNQAVESVKSLLTLCLDTSNTPLCALVFQKVFLACGTSSDAVQWTIVPLVPVVTEIIKGRRLTADAHPFDQFFRESVRVFIVVVLPSKVDSSAIAEWSKTIKSPCGCGDCVEVNGLIHSSGGRTEVTWRALQAKRTHVEQRLARVPGLKFSTIRSGSPHALVITKRIGERDPVAPYAKKARILQTLRLLQAMGPDTVIQRVYSSAPARLAAIMDMCRGQAVASNLLGTPEVWSVQPQPSPPSASSSSSSGTGSVTAAQAGSSVPAGISAQPASTIPRKRKKVTVNPDDIIELSD